MQDADISDSAELAALVASMNTVCSTNPVLVGQSLLLSIYR